jgi:hypothetical protein
VLPLGLAGPPEEGPAAVAGDGAVVQAAVLLDGLATHRALPVVAAAANVDAVAAAASAAAVKGEGAVADGRRRRSRGRGRVISCHC